MKGYDASRITRRARERVKAVGELNEMKPDCAILAVVDVKGIFRKGKNSCL